MKGFSLRAATLLLMVCTVFPALAQHDSKKHTASHKSAHKTSKASAKPAAKASVKV